jgi:hypothetical protein
VFATVRRLHDRIAVSPQCFIKETAAEMSRKEYTIDDASTPRADVGHAESPYCSKACQRKLLEEWAAFVQISVGAHQTVL